MSWRKISMKFAGTCIVCNQRIEANETGFWAKDEGVKHEKCAQTPELKCVICGAGAGCAQCEFATDCDLDRVSQMCICNKCNGAGDPFAAYQNAVKKKFRILNT